MINKIKFVKGLTFAFIFVLFIGNKNNINNSVFTVLIFIVVSLCLYNGFLHFNKPTNKKIKYRA